ncbi:MAG: phenylacetate--CoA ligase family protein, partial [Opitutaceae bacterium]|nr:phenylacetate--CoA ligase family protein [Opitutaceae bacterium]
KNTLYPLYETGIRRRNTLHYLKLLDKNQWKSLEELKADQWRDLKVLLQHAYAQSPYYRKQFDHINLIPDDIITYEDFQKLPVCSREDIVNFKDQMIVKNLQGNIIDKATGRSTGVPMQFAITQDSYEWRVAATQRGYQWAHCEAGQHTLYIWGGEIGNPSYFSKLKINLYHRVFNRKMFNLFNFNEDEMKNCLNYINKKRPTGIVAFTSAIYNLAKFVDSNKLSVSPISAVITGAEKLHDYQRTLIENVFQTKVFNTYGCREFMLIAAECEQHEGLHVTMDNLLVEILKDGKPAQPGETGEVVITDLHNYGMPFIRYKNGDVAVQGNKPCSCGRGLPLIKDIDGRKMDEIIATDGKIISGGYFPHLMKEFSAINKYQVIQKSKNQLQIKLVLKRDLTQEQFQFCQSEIKKVFGQDMNIEFDIVNDIPLTPTGKYRVTISEIAAH